MRLATTFLLAQMVALVSGSLLGIQLEALVAEIGVALAAVFLAREALRSVESRKQLNVLAACAGVAHGFGIQNLVSVRGGDTDPSVLCLLLFALGMDAALLVSVTVLSMIGRIRPGWLIRVSFSKMAAYGVAGAAFAFAISGLVNGPTAEATDADRRLQLPSMLTPSGGSALPGSRRVASNAPDAAVQSFLAIEAFEIRHEVLVRLREVAESVDIGPGPEVGIEAQSDLKERVREFAHGRASLEIDGEVRAPVSQRVDFITLDEKGVLPRPTPVPELVETALVGVTTVYLTKTTAQDLSLTWEFIDAALEIPATVTDPETSRSTVLTPKEPILRWKNELAEDPVPRVSTVEVEPATFTVPLWSLLPLAAAFVLAFAAVRRPESVRSLALARVMLVIAVLLGPMGNLAIALPASFGSVPSASQAKRILAGVLPNVYRALEFREEAVVFDCLSLSVTGETLTEVYLAHRKALAMEERGGAQGRVEAVEIIEIDSVEADDSGGFFAKTVWTVGGTVTHFGHRHFRQNRYDARLAVVPDQSIWKIRSIEVLNEERLR